MRFVLWMLVLLVICSIIYVATQLVESKGVTITQQLIEDKIELEIINLRQANTIESQAEEIKGMIAEREEIFKAALEVADENYALHQIIEDMVVSMKQMLEYIESLEDRDA
ncbi:hypothetical protein LCGC14_3046580 [marine sediment metagenome]|uniref:Uncharacterized protein n=1 Tax=marine sediment metagenome TaxID=412755 RepID=A0A0F8ZDW3_9ZZZZ